jgi:hypothetical protein
MTRHKKRQKERQGTAKDMQATAKGHGNMAKDTQASTRKNQRLEKRWLLVS